MAKKNNNLSDLGSQLKKELKKITIETNELSKFVARQVMKDLVEGTVVDTSKAISNWVANLDSPHEGEIEAHYPGKKGSTELESADVTLLVANNAINEKKFGQPIFISNDIEGSKYIDNARVLEAAQEATDNAIAVVAKAELLIGDYK